MHRSLVAGLLAAATALFASSVFASGYGPAPFYRPDTGAPASQRGPGADTFGTHTFFSRHARAEAKDRTDVGGVDTYGTQSGTDTTSPNHP